MENNIKLQVGVKIILKDKDGKILLLRRSLDKYPEAKGRWDIPGGRINPGSSLIDNLKREVKEETKLEIINVPNLILAQDIFATNNRHIVRLTYVGNAEGEVVLDKEENDIFKWVSLNELQKEKDLDIFFKEILEKKLI